MIYFLRRVDGAIKIGTTKKYYTRQSSLTRQFGKLELLGVMEGNREQEHEIHGRFAHLRLNSKRNTEWFQPHPELLDFIAENTSHEVRTARDITLKLSDKTYLLLKSFQNEQFAKTGKRLTNDEAIALAIQLADPRSVQWVEEFLAKNANVTLSPTKTYNRTS
jgi:hypothetical protein